METLKWRWPPRQHYTVRAWWNGNPPPSIIHHVRWMLSIFLLMSRHVSWSLEAGLMMDFRYISKNMIIQPKIRISIMHVLQFSKISSHLCNAEEQFALWIMSYSWKGDGVKKFIVLKCHISEKKKISEWKWKYYNHYILFSNK